LKQEYFMQAIVIRQSGGPEQLVLAERPDPQPATDQVLIEVKAFGINQAELYFRAGHWAPAAEITGIECAGIVRRDPSGKLPAGQPVLALLGGLARQLNGTYAELVAVPASNVVPVEARLGWEELAALPVAYGCAWSILHSVLQVGRGERVLVRGATSALGRALVRLGRRDGLTVFASSRSAAGQARLLEIGAHVALQEHGSLGAELAAAPLDAAIDLVGTSTIVDTLAGLRRGGRACIAGFLGGADALQIQPVFAIPSGRALTSFASALVLGGPEFPLAEVPFQSFIDDIADGRLRSDLFQVIPFERTPDAHRMLAAGGLPGKLVVRTRQAHPGTPCESVART
jgi:NADPH:quinone reductase-like Zn-dependent oxidoreductase